MSDSTMAAICSLTALVALVVFFCWLVKDLGKPAQKTPLMAKKEEADQDTNNYNCILTDEKEKFVALVEKNCQECKHCYLHAVEFMACNYFSIAAPHKKDYWISCNAARNISKLCGHEAKHFQPKEKNNNTQ